VSGLAWADTAFTKYRAPLAHRTPRGQPGAETARLRPRLDHPGAAHALDGRPHRPRKLLPLDAGTLSSRTTHISHHPSPLRRKMNLSLAAPFTPDTPKIAK
jgi:hypothetical protein